MAAGIQCWDNTGKLLIDTNTMTGRIIGTRISLTAPYLERLTVPISTGKRLWWHFYTVGNIRAYLFRATYVDPSLNQKENQFTIQIDASSWWGGQTGTVHVFYGEY